MVAEWKAVFWLVAVVLLVIAAVFSEVARSRDGGRGVNLGWLALAFFVFPFLWDAADAGWFND